MLIKDLKHNLLNYWVGKALGLDVVLKGEYCWLYSNDPAGWTMYMPSIKGDLVLAIMKNAGISVKYVSGSSKQYNDEWVAYIGEHCKFTSNDLNVALLQCLIATKYGERVDE
jgi:hypothetical protein